MRSIAQQLFPSLEIIIVDDASTDLTPLVIDEMAGVLSKPLKKTVDRMMNFQNAFAVLARRGFYAALLSFSCAVGLAAERENASPESSCSGGNADPVDGVDQNDEVTIRYFRRLDSLIAGFRVDIAHETAEKLAELADELLAKLTDDVATVYLLAYLEKEIPRATPLKKKWLQQLLDRVNELHAMNEQSRRALVRNAARDGRVSTLLFCLNAFPFSTDRAEAAKALANFKEPRVIGCLCKTVAFLAWYSDGGGADGEWHERVALQNAVIQSLSATTGLDLALVSPPPHSMRADETGEEFSARLVAARYAEPDRCLDAAVRGVQWLRINEPRAFGMFEADCAAAAAQPRPLMADTRADAADFFGLQPFVYFQVISNLLIVRTRASVASSEREPSGQHLDERLSKIVEVVPLVHVRPYFTEVIPRIPPNRDKELHRRLLDRLDALRAMDAAPARALVAESARQRHISTLLVCFCALRDAGLRSEAAKALADFKEPRIVRCLCMVLAVMAHCASAEDGDAALEDVALQNAIIKSLSTLTSLDLALLGAPPQGACDGESKEEFAARLAAARRDGRDRSLEAAGRCEEWLDRSTRRNTDKRE